MVEATTAAKAWKADAVLIQIATGGVGPDGRDVAWDYGFYSPNAKTCAVINIFAAGPHLVESGGEICASPELREPFIDSDEAATIARANGITAPETTMIVSMSAAGDRPQWSVMDDRGMDTGNVMLDIDAVSGKVVGKTAQR
jgi:hypothetical protein